jgi:hypothetical protein
LQFSAALHSSLLFWVISTDIGCPRDVRFSPESDRVAASHCVTLLWAIGH